jgi:pimeloyl-ACP methyl ester carboxylesterase
MAEVMLGDIRIHYLDTGLPDADVILLLLHAFPLQAGMWDEQLRRFGDRYRLIAPDLKGFGGSDAPNDPAAYSVESYADDAAGLLSLLDLERAVVAGQGVLGGQVALALFERHREQVAALVLAGVSPDAATPEEAAANATQQHWIRVEGDLQLLINRLVDRLVGRETSRRAEAVRLARQLMGANPPAGWIGGLEALTNRPDFGPDLDKIDVPTLVVRGAADELVPRETADAMVVQIPDVELVTVADAGHRVSLEQPEAVSRAVEGLLERI